MAVQGLSSITDYYNELIQKKAAEAASTSSAISFLTGNVSTENGSEDENSFSKILEEKQNQ